MVRASRSNHQRPGPEGTSRADCRWSDVLDSLEGRKCDTLFVLDSVEFVLTDSGEPAIVKELLDLPNGTRFPHADGAIAVRRRKAVMELELRGQGRKPLLSGGPEFCGSGDRVLDN